MQNESNPVPDQSAKQEELRRQIQAGPDDTERGDFAELDMAAI